MKPARDLDISKRNVSRPRDGQVQPISKLAAAKEDQKADRFAFTDEDRQILADVLASDERAGA